MANPTFFTKGVQYLIQRSGLFSLVARKFKMLKIKSDKRPARLVTGTASLLLGLSLFIYFGTRPRATAQTIDPERQRQILTHDILTFAGLAFIFTGLFILLSTAAKSWRQNPATDGHGPKDA